MLETDTRFLCSDILCEVGKVGYKEARILKKMLWKREERIDPNLYVRNNLDARFY